LASIPYCDFNLWQPSLYFVNIGDSLVETLAIQKKVDSLDLASFGTVNAFASTQLSQRLNMSILKPRQDSSTILWKKLAESREALVHSRFDMAAISSRGTAAQLSSVENNHPFVRTGVAATSLVQ
jgi:hypothetical protein